MQNVTKTFVASASELQSSDLYMTVKTTMFTVPSANLNGVRCTAEFLDEIVENQDKYVTLPLCADVVNLVKGKYDKLGHCYNARTGVFSSTMIGSFYKFEKEEMENGETALVGYARIMKRNRNVCKAIGELFAEGALKVSFEISCGSYEELDDGTILIDRSDKNFLEGMCVVSFPACPDAVAHALVAEINSIGKEVEDMNENEMIEIAEAIVEDQPETEEVVAEEIETAEEIENSEQQTEVETAEAEERTEIAQEQPADETAEVRVSLHHHECDTVSTYDTETGISTETTVTVNESVYGVPAEGIAQATTAEEQVESAEEQVAEIEESETVDASEKSDDEEDEKKCGMTASEKMLEQVIAELAAMRKELEELRMIRAEEQSEEAEEVIAETEHEIAEIEAPNPFIAEISTPRRYSLLESTATEGYSLLEKA